MSNTSIKLKLLWKKGKRCAICGKKIKEYEDLTVDHIIPLSKGGVNSLRNCQLAHAACNREKDDYMPDAYEKLLKYNRRRTIKTRILHMFLPW